MNLEHIQIHSYRNISKVHTDVSSYGNIIIAQNGSGKTNFLEAIYFSILGTSFRPINSHRELVQEGNEYMRVESQWDKTYLEAIVARENNVLRKKIKINGKTRAQKAAQEVSALILFAPHSVQLLNGEPALRRMDLDTFLSFCFPSYGEILKKYSTVLKNRNALIRAIQEKKSSRKELIFWTESLTKAADQIFHYRYVYFTEINPYLQRVAEQLYHQLGNFNVSYVPNIAVTDPELFFETLSQKYRDNEEKEIIVGKTLYGIHKDDYDLFLNYQHLKYMGSRGQQRIGSFMLKIAQYRYLLDKTQKRALLLIDDLMSELDETHRENLGNFLLENDWQFILTGADIHEIPKRLQSAGKSIAL